MESEAAESFSGIQILEVARGFHGWTRIRNFNVPYLGGDLVCTNDQRRFVMPRKIHQLIADLEVAGFRPVPGGKGSHRKFRHPRFAGAVILSGKTGDDAQHYQEKQVRHAIHEVSQ